MLLQQRTCDVCGQVVPSERMGHLWKPSGRTPEEIQALVEAEVRRLDPLVMMTQGGQILQQLHLKHQGDRYDVCLDCCEALTKWTVERLMRWAAEGWQRPTEGR